MKKTSHILVLAFLVCQGCSESSINEVSFNGGIPPKDATISLCIRHALRIPHNTITVQVEHVNGQHLLKADTNPMEDCSSANEYRPFHNEKKPSEKWYQEISSLLDSLNWNQLRKKEADIGLDGSTWTLTYKHGQTENIVSIWSPNYKTRQRGLQNFLRASEFLLRTADIDPKTSMPK